MNGLEMPEAPELGSLQLAWLEELGLDRRLLSRYTVRTETAPAQETPKQAGSPEAAHIPGVAAGDAASSAPAADSASTRDGVAAARGLLRSLLGKKDAAPLPLPAVPEDRPSAKTTEAAPEPGTLDALRHAVLHCQACALHQDRGTGVFGEGNTQSPAWLVIGEAPGTMDDRVGAPFQGRSGELLRAMLKAAGADASADVFFTNVVKCRPIANRPPVAEEVAQCGLHLRSQVALLQPGRILALGRVAAAALTGQDADLESLRGKVWQYECVSGRRIPVIATYHPGWLLTHPYHKAGAWQDLRLARDLGKD
ncbi:uracil-DNA glycosylase [Paracandidimonas soli]|nr:uracil-DNA glycosylase [Paracandidimonas soli]